MSKRVLFYDPNMNERGTSSAIYDYADYNETILENQSFIVGSKKGENTNYKKFAKRFETLISENLNEVQNIANQLECQYFYTLKYGFNDGIILKKILNCVHVVFPSYEPHGDVYAYVSEWLSREYGQNSPFVPHMINLPDDGANYKDYFKIHDKFVFGWYGGKNFEIEFAQKAVIQCARTRKDAFFLFMNQEPFCSEPNVVFLPVSYDPYEKVRFINTCDVMLHANNRGETFGLAIGEFSSKNKPVITYSLKDTLRYNYTEKFYDFWWEHPGKNHILTLGKKGIYYDNQEQLLNILMNIEKKEIVNKDWNCFKEYTPVKVMKKFNEVFLK
jgi:hypothetical protein